MAALCRRFGVSRKTGYKILNRYNDCGLEGLTDRSRRPYRHANQLPVQIETLIVRSKHNASQRAERRNCRSDPDLRKGFAPQYYRVVAGSPSSVDRRACGTRYDSLHRRKPKERRNFRIVRRKCAASLMHVQCNQSSMLISI
jgi:Helix-turn-helix domain